MQGKAGHSYRTTAMGRRGVPVSEEWASIIGHLTQQSVGKEEEAANAPYPPPPTVLQTRGETKSLNNSKTIKS